MQRQAPRDAVASVDDGANVHATILVESAGWQRDAFERYRGLVHSLLNRALGPGADLHDLVGDVFVTFFEHAAEIRNPRSVRGYLVSITMNLVRAEARRRKRRASLVALGGPHDGDDVFGPDDPRARAALSQLTHILDELHTEERIAFVLYGFDDMPLGDIARVLKVSLSTAKRRVKRASEHVRKRMSRNALLADYVTLGKRAGPYRHRVSKDD